MKARIVPSRCVQARARLRIRLLRADALATTVAPAGLVTVSADGDAGPGLSAEAVVWTGSGTIGDESTRARRARDLAARRTADGRAFRGSAGLSNRSARAPRCRSTAPRVDHVCPSARCRIVQRHSRRAAALDDCRARGTGLLAAACRDDSATWARSASRTSNSATTASSRPRRLASTGRVTREARRCRRESRLRFSRTRPRRGVADRDAPVQEASRRCIRATSPHRTSCRRPRCSRCSATCRRARRHDADLEVAPRLDVSGDLGVRHAAATRRPKSSCARSSGSTNAA